MISIGGTDPPLPTSNRSFPLPPLRSAASHDLQQTPRSWPRQTSNSTLNVPASSQDASEPAFKRQKIGDSAIELIGKTSGTLRSLSEFSNATSNKAAILISSADSLEERERAEKEQQPYLFPIRPGKISQAGGNQQSRALAIERATAKDVVPVKPYIPEPPSFAPRFHRAGKRLSFLRSHLYLVAISRTGRLLPLDRMSRRGCPQRVHHQTRLLRQSPGLPERV